MRLTSLHPEFGIVPNSTHQPTGQWWLQFDCRCGPPYRVYIQFHKGGALPGLWTVTAGLKIHPHLEHLGEMPDMETLTLTPSIINNSHGPQCGPRHKHCGQHYQIINGDVTQ